MASDARQTPPSSFPQGHGTPREQPFIPLNDENRRVRSQSETTPRQTYPIPPSSYAPGLSGPPPSSANNLRQPPSSYPSDYKPVGAGQSIPGHAGSAQPIREAVNSAFRTEPKASDDPELVARVTEQVLKTLSLSGITTKPSSTTSSSVHSHSVDVPPRNVLTPPSPDAEDFAGPGGDIASHARPGETINPEAGPRVEGESEAARKYRPDPPSPERHQGTSQKTSTPSRVNAQETQPTDDATTLEKIWQPLFDSNGEPTERLGQFLRGLAIHIIEDFEPKYSIVVSPAKMLKFFESMQLSNEVIPWRSIFCKIPMNTLSHLYRDLECSHHYVQPTPDERPTVPSLTPDGFQVFMTYIIQAYPDHEFDRFAKVATYMPINNAADPKERFPKELPRRLFPKYHDKEIRDTVDNIVQTRTGEKLKPIQAKQGQQSPPKSTPQPPPAHSHPSQPAHTVVNPSGGPPRSAPTSAPSQTSACGPPQPNVHKENRSGSIQDSAVDDVQPPVAIERERKPYSAAPGGGKVYDNGSVGTGAIRHDAHRSEGPPRSDRSDRSEIPRSSGPIPQRANSTTSSSRPPNLEAPEANGGYRQSIRPRSGSQNTGGSPARMASAHRRSPSSHSTTPRGSAFTRSETEIPYTYVNPTSNLHRDEDTDLRRFNSHNPEMERRSRPGNYGPPPPQYSGDQYRRNSLHQPFPPPPMSDGGR